MSGGVSECHVVITTVSTMQVADIASGLQHVCYAQGVYKEECDCRVDVWDRLKPRDPGLTYDGKSNQMLGPYNRLRKRLDRVYCKTCRYKLDSIKMVGTKPLPGVTFTKSYKKGPTLLPVLPSDHFGLLAMLKYAS